MNPDRLSLSLSRKLETGWIHSNPQDWCEPYVYYKVRVVLFALDYALVQFTVTVNVASSRSVVDLSHRRNTDHEVVGHTTSVYRYFSVISEMYGILYSDVESELAIIAAMSQYRKTTTGKY